MTEKNRPSEIDLIDLFLRIYRFFKRNLLILIIAFVIGAAYSTYKKLSSKKLLRSEYIIDISPNEIIVISDIFDNINELLKSNRQRFKEQFDFTDDIVAKLKKISFEFEKPKDEGIPSISVSLVIIHGECDSIDQVSSRIIQYVNNRPFFAKRQEMRLKQYNERMAEVIRKIMETDSLQKIFVESYLKNNKLVYLDQESGHTALQNQKLHLIAEKQKLEREIEYIDIMYIVDGITAKHRTSFSSLFVYPLITTILGLIIVFFREIKRIEKKRNQN